MADTLAVQPDAAHTPDAGFEPNAASDVGAARGADAPVSASPLHPSVSFQDLWGVLIRRRRFVGSTLGGLLVACLLYCLVAPKQYEATAKIAVRTAPASTLSLDAIEASSPASLLSAPIQQETLAGVLRSEQLAWRVICNLKLYDSPAFKGRFERKFPGFRAEAPGAAAQAFLLERFAARLNVQTIPRTLLIQIRFRSKDPGVSAAVVNRLIEAYSEEDAEMRMKATHQSAEWLQAQVSDLKMRVELDQKRLSDFQRQNGILSTPETLSNGQPGQVEHVAGLQEIDDLSRQQVVASSDRILREAQYRAAERGDPESVVASEPQLQAESGFATSMLGQLHAHHSELEQEQARLRVEHGLNFPRVLEIRGQLQDLDRQIQVEDAKLLERFRSAWQTAQERELLVHKHLEERTSEAMSLNQAATRYALMRQEADASHELYMRVLDKLEEAGLSAGVHGSNVAVVDRARPPAKPVTPNLPLAMAITCFVGIWLATGGALVLETFGNSHTRAVVALLACILCTCPGTHAQAPTPSTSGLPSGVAHMAPTQDTKTVPNPREAPAIWNASGTAPTATVPGPAIASVLLAAPISAGDLLDIGEFQTPEFHAQVRVSAVGTVALPMVQEVSLKGLDEQAAARAIETALVAKGILLHPQVSVMVMAYAGQDVSVLGEVARPGVYPYTLHHRLLDLLSAASGLSSTAGRLVNVYHRDDPQTPHPVVLDPAGADSSADHNPELAPGDTVQVSRAGLVYVIGSVVRPGGFPVDPAQGLTVVQALSLAWGPSLNASTQRAVLIREQAGGRTLTTMNLKRLLHGQDPDQPIRDRDILFVPDSTAKNLWNRTMEAAIQSAVGVTIYAGLVYSQRF